MIAIKTENDDILWFDAVVSYNEDYSRSVTAFPVQSGTTIADHIADENKRLSLAGLFTSVGFSTPIQGYGFEGFADEVVDAVVVDYNKPSPLQKLVPQGIANLISPSVPEVTVSTTPPKSYKTKVQFLKDIWESKSFVSLIEIDERGVLEKQTDDLVITNISFPEGADDGDSLSVSINFERVRVVTLLIANAPVVDVKDRNFVEKVSTGVDKGTGASATGGLSNPVEEAVEEAAKRDQSIWKYITTGGSF